MHNPHTTPRRWRARCRVSAALLTPLRCLPTPQSGAPSGLSVLYTRQQAELLVVQVEAEAARGDADEGEGG